MLLGKLNGYDEVNDVYTDSFGSITELPKESFVVANSLPSDYDDFSDLPENWVNYSLQLIKKGTFGFKDILCARSIFKPLITAICGTNYSEFDDLSDEQKNIALTYFPTKIVDSQGFAFLASKAGSSDNAVFYLDNYQKICEPARKNRYNAISNYVYGNLGKNGGLLAERYAQTDSLDISYTRRGVLWESEDGISGLGDWLVSTGDYTLTGLKARIDNAEFTILTGLSSTTFCNNCVIIVENGLY